MNDESCDCMSDDDDRNPDTMDCVGYIPDKGETLESHSLRCRSLKHWTWVKIDEG